MRTLFEGRRVRLAGEGAYREVWLTRPERRNALDIVMRDELYEVLLEMLDDGEAGAVGLLGEGPDFCAGGDLSEFGTRPDVSTAWQTRHIRALPSLFAELGPKLIAGIHGAAVGAGIELAAFASRIVAAEDARFMLPEAAFGLIPGSGGTLSIPRRIGRHRCFEMAMSATWVASARALEWGLVDEIVPADRVVSAVRSVAADRSI